MHHPMEKWNTTQPDSFDYSDDDWEQDCDHEDYDADPISGRARCWRCGHAWYLTVEDIRREERHEAAYAAIQRHDALWRVRFWRWIVGLSWPLRGKDDIPF